MHALVADLEPGRFKDGPQRARATAVQPGRVNVTPGVA